MINNFILESSIDFPGNFGPVIFTSGCNFNCGFCHNAILNRKEKKDFLDENKIIREIKEKVLAGWYTGVCITGGEPLLHKENLERLIRKLKSIGLKIKVDTNGSNPNFLKKLFQDKLIDYVAMDIKGPRELYNTIADTQVYIEDIEESIKFLLSLDKSQFEFRTTIPLILEENDFRFMNEKELANAGKWILSLNGRKDFNWILQAFFSRTKEEMNDGRMSIESLPKEMHETPKEHLESLKKVLNDYCELVDIR